MNRGPKGISPEMQKARGTYEPGREVVALYPDHASRPDPAEMPPPKGMTRAARAIWDVKVARYRQRGQKVQGFEDSLRQYCELEAKLNRMWAKGDTPPMAMVNGHRLFCGEFFDTPAAQKVSAHGKPTGNAFARNGRRDAAPPAAGGTGGA